MAYAVSFWLGCTCVFPGCRDTPPPYHVSPSDGCYAGVGVQELDIPVGVPQSGYAARYKKIPLLSLILGGGSIRLPDARISPYADCLFPTIGLYTHPNAKCLSIESRKAGSSQRLILCRVELAFVTDLLRRRVLEIVHKRSGLDLQRNLLLAASHTHAAGSRFWRLPYFSDFASDTFHPEVFERIAWSIAKAVIESLETMDRARIGLGILKPFDPQDELFRDRRLINNSFDLVDATVPWRVGESGCLVSDGLPDGSLKDDQLTILRIDRYDGSPYALVFHFPVHSTTFGPENLFMSSDTSGAIEHQVELSFATPVVAMHLQGASGDIEPSAVKGHPPILVEAQGRWAAPKIMDLYSRIITTDDLQGISCFSKDLRQDYDLLGYDHASEPYAAFDARWGAAQCGVVFPTEPFYCLSRPKAHLPPSRLSSIVGGVISAFLCDELHICSDDWARETIEPLNPLGPPYEQPPEVFHIQHAAALLRGLPRVFHDPLRGLTKADIVDLVLLGYPGEPTTPFSWHSKGLLLEDVRKAGLATGPEEILVCGYMQDYFGYLLTPEDWITGGYEISINLWGPLWGDYMCRHTTELARSIMSGTEPKEATSPLYEPVTVDGIHPRRSDPPITMNEPSDVHRFQTAVFTWRGGYPGVDTPRISVEKQITEQGFEQVLLPNGLPYDDAGPEIVLLYGDNQVWSAYWEIPWDFPVGTYRFVVQGTYYAGGPARNEPPFFPGAPYRLASKPFTVAAALPCRLSELKWKSGRLFGRIAYPAPRYDADANTPDGLRWRPPCPDEVSGTLTFTPTFPAHSEPIVIHTTIPIDNECLFEVELEPSLQPRNYRVTVLLQDVYENPFHAIARFAINSD